MKHLKSLKVVFAALAVSMVPLFGSCYSGAELESERAMDELEQIKSAFNIHSIDWQFPDELPEKFTLRLMWVWETAWFEEGKLTLENIHSEQLGRRFDAEEIVKTGKCRAWWWGIDNTENYLSDTPLRMFVQCPDTFNDGSLSCLIVVGEKVGDKTQSLSKLRVPYPDGDLIGSGGSSGTLGLQFEFDENDVHCHLEFEVVDGW